MENCRAERAGLAPRQFEQMSPTSFAVRLALETGGLIREIFLLRHPRRFGVGRALAETV